MNCPNCGQQVDPGAVFCGNCGFALNAAAAPVITNLPPAANTPLVANTSQPPAYAVPQPVNNPVAQAWQATQTAPPQALAPQPPVPPFSSPSSMPPAYAVAQQPQVHHEVKAILSLVFGIVGILGTFLTAFAGLAFGVAGIVLATLAWRRPKRGLVIVGLVISTLALLFGIGVIAHNVSKLSTTHQTAENRNHAVNTATKNTSDSLETDCYSLSLTTKQTIQHDSGSCDANIFDGSTLDNSNDVYRILADNIPSLDQSHFVSVSEAALTKDITSNFPGADVAEATTFEFAGSPAVKVTATVGRDAVEEAAVMHSTANGDNFFVMVHFTASSSVNLDDLEKAWQWK